MCLCVCSLCRPKCIQYVYVCVYENVSVSLTAPVYVVGVKGRIYIYIHMVFGRVEQKPTNVAAKNIIITVFFLVVGPG